MPVDTPSWREFLHRQEKQLERQSGCSRCARCHSPEAEHARSVSPTKSDGGKKADKKGDGVDKFDLFFKRNMEYRAAKEEYLEQLQDFFCPPRAGSPVQAPWFMERHDPKRVHEYFQEVVNDAQRKWRQDHPLDPGESPLFKKKTVTQEEVDRYWKKNKDYPHVSNREPPTQAVPPVPGFRTSGNPYEGGKADRLLTKLGPKAGITPMNTVS